MEEQTPVERQLRIQKPLVVFDLETTGVDPERDKIVEFSATRFEIGETPLPWTFRVNPAVAIPEEATAIHGISDSDVEDLPRFEQKAEEVKRFFLAADVCGFNVKAFDWPLLEREMALAGFNLEEKGRRFVDVLELFRLLRPKDLSGVFAEFYGFEVQDAHTAEADVQATHMILTAMLDEHPELPAEVGEIANFIVEQSFEKFSARYADPRGRRFFWKHGVPYFSFGKHRGEPLEKVAGTDPGYMSWLQRNGTFESDTRAVIEAAVSGLPITREEWNV